MGDGCVMSYVTMGGTLYSSMTDFGEPIGMASSISKAWVWLLQDVLISILKLNMLLR